jgi:hypothetical protein
MGVSAYASSEQLGAALLATPALPLEQKVSWRLVFRSFPLKKSAKSVEFTSALATVEGSAVLLFAPWYYLPNVLVIGLIPMQSIGRVIRTRC